MKNFKHEFEMELPIIFDDTEDYLKVLIMTKTGLVEHDETKENAVKRSDLILNKIGKSFKSGLIDNIQKRLSQMTDEDIGKTRLKKKVINVIDTTDDAEELLYNDNPIHIDNK